jgi:hypothetical protein
MHQNDDFGRMGLNAAPDWFTKRGMTPSDIPGILRPGSFIRGIPVLKHLLPIVTRRNSRRRPGSTTNLA